MNEVLQLETDKSNKQLNRLNEYEKEISTKDKLINFTNKSLEKKNKTITIVIIILVFSLLMVYTINFIINKKYFTIIIYNSNNIYNFLYSIIYILDK